jgi:hypothetical protein
MKAMDLASKAKLRKLRLQVIDQRAASHGEAIETLGKAYDRLKVDLVSTKIDLEVAMQLLAEQAGLRGWQRRRLITPARTSAMRAALIAQYTARVEREQSERKEGNGDASNREDGGPGEGVGEGEGPGEAAVS